MNTPAAETASVTAGEPVVDGVATIQKCHRLRKAGMSPEAPAGARLCSPQTPNIGGLKSLVGKLDERTVEAIAVVLEAL
jgi:hypothetical protein